MEDYKEKYEQLAKLIKDLYPFMSDYCKEKTEGMIPELKENEDEKIRKELIRAFTVTADKKSNEIYGNGITYGQVLAWLEKQSTPQVRKGNEWVNIIDDACEHRYAEEYAHGEYCHQQSFRWGFQEGVDWLEKQDQKKHEEELENAYKCADEVQYRRGYEDAKREFESQGEQKSQGKSVLEVWKDMRFEVYQQASGNRHEPNYSDDSTKMFSLTNIDEIFEKVAEKQGEQKFVDKCKDCNNVKGCITCTDGNQYAHITEQKTTDKVEPKFHAGDFITDGERIFQIKETVLERNNRNDGSTYCESLIVNLRDGNTYADNTDLKEYHLWTIQDAKAGDVLSYVTDEGNLWIMIYRSLYKPYEGHVHYHALLVNDNFIDKGTCCICIDNLKPATKGQRELLFSKMKEADYEWDAEKKELKKIKQTYFQKQEWTGYDEKAYEIALLDIDKSPSITKNDSIDWLKSLKNRVQPQPKQEWSEEDENMLQNILECLKNGWSKLPTDILKYESWLKSLKKRMKGE